jgi:DNA repair ATPase RecN
MKKLELHNFQAHEKSILKLSPSLNSITGQSDQGKTSILRAIKWIKDNRPRGDAFIRHNTKQAVVILDEITHITGTGGNTYKYQDNTYRALKGEVPEQITDALNIGEDNIQEQHDSIFLLNISPGKVAQKLSELAQLERTTRALSYIKSKIRTVNEEVKATEASIVSNTEVCDKLEFIEDINNEYTQIEFKQAQIESLRQAHSTISLAIKKASDESYKLLTFKNTDDAITAIDSIIKNTIEYTHYKKTLCTLKQVINTIQETQEKVNIRIPNLRVDRLILYKEKLVSLNRAILKIKKEKENLNNIVREHEIILEQWGEMKGKECPLCGKPL